MEVEKEGIEIKRESKRRKVERGKRAKGSRVVRRGGKQERWKKGKGG